jgi:hypothetical protein
MHLHLIIDNGHRYHCILMKALKKRNYYSTRKTNHIKYVK